MYVFIAKMPGEENSITVTPRHATPRFLEPKMKKMNPTFVFDKLKIIIVVVGIIKFGVTEERLIARMLMLINCTAIYVYDEADDRPLTIITMILVVSTEKRSQTRFWDLSTFVSKN